MSDFQSDGTSKAALRQDMQLARKNQAEKDRFSLRVTDRLVAMPQYQAAGCVMWYVDVRDEVRTRNALFDQFNHRRRVVVPYCVGDQLGLFELRSPSELAPGRFGILEPRKALREEANRVVAAEELDLVVVPGVAFDRTGGRLGHGKGFYDRCLQATREDTVRVGLAFDCQIVSRVPVESHDIVMDWVVTENEVIACVH